MRTNAGNLKKGEFVYHQGDIWQVQKADFYSPGKGSALMKARIKNLISGKNIDYAYKSNEQVELLDVQSIEMQYLYKTDKNYNFMDGESFEQMVIPESLIGDFAKFINEGDFIKVDTRKSEYVSRAK